MIHDPDRIERIRAEIQRVVERAVQGESKATDLRFRRRLEIARRSVAAIESMYLRREQTSPEKESRWLAGAENHLHIRAGEVERLLKQLETLGPDVRPIE